jgi:hypothetical protein
MSMFTEALVITPLADGKSWIIVGDFGYDVGAVNSNDRVSVDKGFATDFASVPRVLWWVLPKWGVYGNAAVVHDWLYWHQDRDRKQSDDIMLEAMSVLNVPELTKQLIYRAVRVFGGWAWRRNKWDKDAGLDRVFRSDDIAFSVKIDRPGIFMRTIKQLRVA